MMALLCAAAAATAAPKKDPTPTAHAQRAGLTHIVEQVQHAAQRGERPVVIVDIDDTVLDRSVLHRLATGNGKDGLLADTAVITRQARRGARSRR